MNRQKLYWILQVSGWGIYALTNILLSIALPNNRVDITSIIALAAFYLFSTNLFRLVIKRYGFLSFSLNRLVLVVFTGIIILSFFNILFQIGLGKVFDTLNSRDLRVSVLSVNFLFAFLYYSLWSMIYFVYFFFNNYNNSLKYEAAINEIKLNHLRAQLNPHFIFNALNSVRALVDEDPIKAKMAITQLSNILRNSLIMDKKRLINFEDELNTVKDYLALETIRFEERLQVDIQIDPEAYDFNVPPMMVQTLVENGIKHGISNLIAGGKIELKARVKENGNLYISIVNSGRLSSVVSKRKHGGHGINNTKQRLKLIYGDKAYFKIYNKDESHVAVDIEIPTKD